MIVKHNNYKGAYEVNKDYFSENNFQNTDMKIYNNHSYSNNNENINIQNVPRNNLNPNYSDLMNTNKLESFISRYIREKEFDL